MNTTKTQIFCFLCKKTFVSYHTLNRHHNKYHTEIELPYNQSVYEYISDSMQCSEYTISFSLSENLNSGSEFNESFSENIFVLSDDEECINIDDHSEKMTCSQQQHCDTCTCYQKPVEVTIQSAIMKSMEKIQYKTEHKLPVQPIRDVCLFGDKMLETDTNGDKLCRDIPFKHYYSPEITKRVVDQQYEYTYKSLNSYRKQNQYKHTYLNFKNGLTNYEAVMKYTIENDINYNADTFNPVFISYDVEAFNLVQPADNQKASHKNGGIMSMICASFVQQNKIDLFKVYILDQYTYNEEQITQSIIERRTESKIQNPEQFNLIIIECANQTIMACQFLDDVKSCGISLMFGFNSSSTCQLDKIDDNGKITERMSVGYDLPFIIYNSCRQTNAELEYGSKIFGKIGKQIKCLSWLPNTYILDCQVIFQNDRFFAMNLSELPNKRLNSFLQFAGIPLKADDMNIYQRMDQMRIKNSDQTSTISYCLWDAYALTLVMKKIKYIDSVKANVSIFNIPLSWALHKNASTWIAMSMLRKYYKSGQSFSYSKFDMPAEKTMFRGATTEACPEKLQMQVLKNILMGDYEALYPNCIIAGNLGIDSITDENDTNAYKVNLNFIDKYLVQATKDKTDKLSKQEISLLESDQNPQYVYFSKKPSIYATIVSDVLQQRLQTKKLLKQASGLEYEQLDARQNALKIMVNTIYGLSGCKTFQLYDERVGSSCTSLARLLNQIARESTEQLGLGNVVFRDTDSCGIMNVQPNTKEIISNFNNLNTLINQKLQTILNNTHTINFVPEIGNYQLKTYFPKAKKAYARIECNLSDMKPSLKIKGVSWSLMSEYGKQFFRDHTEYILNNLTHTDEIQEYVNQVIQSVQNDVDTLIQTKNYSELIRKYHKQIKNSGNNKTAIYLQKRYNVRDNEIQILPIVKASKLKSECVIPASICSEYKINANQLIEWFISPFQKFYGKQQYEQQVYDDLEETFKCRTATKFGYDKDIIELTYQDIISKLGNSDISYNEIVKSENKLFFDIDDAKNAVNFQKCLEIFEQMICKFKHQSIEVKYAYTKSTCKNKPHSYHVVYQIRSSLAMNEYIAKSVNEYFNFEIVDVQLYSANKSLRLPNSPKYSKETKQLVQVYHNIVQGTLEQMFITDISDIQNSLSNAIGFIKQPHKELGYNSYDLSEKYIQAIKQYIPFAYDLNEKNQGVVELIPHIKPYKCPVCDSNHSSLNMIVYLQQNGFVINCWSKQNKAKILAKDIEGNKKESTTIKHKFEVQTAVSNKQQRLNELLTYIKQENNYKFKSIKSDNISFQNNSQVKYDLSAQTTFVRSQMMTGKTKQQIELVNGDQYPTIVALSFRRTFARDNASKNNFSNYEDIQHELNLVDYPRLIIQVDSLARLNMNIKPSLLIIDEIESVIEQLTSITRDTTPYILYKFIQLLQMADKVLCLDAELEQQTIQVISTLIGTDNYKVFVNTYQPKTESKIIINDYVSNNTAHQQQIIEQVKSLVDADKKVVVFCTGRKFAECIKNSIPNNKIVKYYDGNDAGKQDGISKALIKSQDFKDVNSAWSQCDVLIYTATLTAGISFENHHFDTFVGIHYKRTASALAFTQGLHRVRNFKDKLGYLYLEKQTGYLPQTAYQITQNQTAIYGHTDLSETSQFANWIQASVYQSYNHSLKLIIRNLKNMGYNLEVQGLNDTGVRNNLMKVIKAEQMKQIAQAQINIDDLTRIPKILKSNTLLINDKDEQLQAKYDKVKIFKSFYINQDQESIDKINALNAEQITTLYTERPRINNSNKIKQIVKKCLEVRPELKDLQIEQMDQLIEACQLESKQNIKAQLVGTSQKNSILKFNEQIYTIKTAINVNNIITINPNTESMQSALEYINSDKTLKALGFKFKANGVNKKLNELLCLIDLQITAKQTGRVRINNKSIRENTYSISSISAQSILDSLHNK